jgi:cytochrome c1
MPQPMFANQVVYADGTPATIEQMASDVTHFLTWTAEPKMEERKRMGFAVILFLAGFAGLCYASYRRLWQDAH